MDKVQLFMRIYMYELEMFLNSRHEELLEIQYQVDEANTDRPLKEYIKNVIENECNCINELSNISYVSIEGEEPKIYTITDEIINIFIQRVLLPEDITSNIRYILQSRKNAVFTNPDICLEINVNGQIVYETVELKSTKNDSIPGSSVQQVSPEEWAIFIKHTPNIVRVTTGQYLYAINSKMQFPDRSPRPQVSFSELQNWNNQYRERKNKALCFYLSGDESVKYNLLTDWQGVLAKRWVEILLNSEPSKRIPWFHNNLRIFILEFLNEYDRMTPLQQKAYKEFVERLIE